MPAIRGQYLTHPTTGEAGFWIERISDPPGTLTGTAFGGTFLVRQGQETQAQCEARLSGTLQTAAGLTITIKVWLLTSAWPMPVLDPERSIEVREVR